MFHQLQTMIAYTESRNAVPFFQRTDRSTFLHAKGAPFPVDCFFRPAKTSPFRPVPNKTE
ncbi:hypothetical protein GS8_1517 [Geobacillus stearothermophilus]|uniref:Uncharacterized protein n=1 Tax=Geobacillus stearothermophilus TaxID=1422 RepID=A0ABQ7HFD8_GEOSE|nr:hypothetical protein GS8_1517 [Geobacillus stearothermophilus]